MQDELNDEQIDSLVNEIEDSSQPREIPMTEQEAAPPQPQQDQAAQQAQAIREIEFNWNGKQIKAPIEKATQWAAQGYDYAQKMGEWNKQRAEYEAKLKQSEEIFNRYGHVDEYAKSNPEWFKHVMEQYEQREKLKAEQTNNPLYKDLVEVRNELQGLKEFKDQITNKEMTQLREAEDKKLDTEIQSIRENYKNIDWNSVDASGKNLELRVLEHADANGIKSFRAAFRDYLHDTLVKTAEEKGKEAVSKDRQKQTKLGLIGKTEAPTKQLTTAKDIKAKSYDDLLREGLEELGIGAH